MLPIFIYSGQVDTNAAAGLVDANANDICFDTDAANKLSINKASSIGGALRSSSVEMASSVDMT